MTNIELETALKRLLPKTYSLDVSPNKCFYIHRKGEDIPVACINKYGNEDALFIRCLSYVKQKTKLTAKIMDALVSYYEMCISCLAYNVYNDSTALRADAERWSCVYRHKLNAEVAEGICAVMFKAVNRVYQNVGTDGEGCTYNGIDFV